MFHQAKKINFKRFGEMDSVEGKTNGTGIRFKYNQLIWNGLNIKVSIDKKDVHAQIALQDRIKYYFIVYIKENRLSQCSGLISSMGF